MEGLNKLAPDGLDRGLAGRGGGGGRQLYARLLGQDVGLGIRPALCASAQEGQTTAICQLGTGVTWQWSLIVATQPFRLQDAHLAGKHSAAATR